jgi:pyruvate dehydrogenase E2 component (dihydrolipoamide acetyltransferase)
MLIDIVVPRIGEAVPEVTLLQWVKHEGDSVKKGDVLFLIDTDKAVIEIEAFLDGKLVEILAGEGSLVKPGQVVALLEGEGVSPEEIRGSRSLMEAMLEKRILNLKRTTPDAGRTAQVLGDDLEKVIDTGVQGAINIQDVQIDARSALVQDETSERTQPPSSGQQEEILEVEASKISISASHWIVDVDMAEVEGLQTHCLQELGWENPPTFVDVIVCACARSLVDFPTANRIHTDEGIVSRNSVDIGIALDGGEGWIVPVISHASTLRLEEISRLIGELKAHASERRLREDNFAGKSMVVIDFGEFGVDAFMTGIDIRRAVVLAVGRIVQRLIPVEGGHETHPFCMLTLSADSLIVDGLQGASFLKRITEILQKPFQLLA